MILTFMIDSLSSCFFIYYIYTIHSTVVKLGDVRTRNRCFGCWTLCLSYYLRSPTHTINICCEKENKVVVKLFAANEVFTIIEITFTPRHFLIFFQFQYLLSVWLYCSYSLNSIIKKFIDECWAADKNCREMRCNKSLLVFQTVSSPCISQDYSSIIHQSVNLILVITLHSIQ